jgi:hypothetical protein
MQHILLQREVAVGRHFHILTLVQLEVVFGQMIQQEKYHDYCNLDYILAGRRPSLLSSLLQPSFRHSFRLCKALRTLLSVVQNYRREEARILLEVAHNLL